LTVAGCGNTKSTGNTDSGEGSSLVCEGENGALLYNSCKGCHDASFAPDLDEAVPRLSDGELISILEDGIGEMAPPNLTPCEEDAVLLYLRATFGEFGGG
jgi:hypothetical protein